MTTDPGQHAVGTEQSAAAAARPPEENLSHDEMNTALERGLAVPVSRAIGWLMRYRAAWWVLYEDGWLRVPDGPVADRLDRLYPRLAEAEAQAAAEAARNRNRRQDED